ncbi:fimbrial protein [Serratia sp. DD3]|uniref:fimbrial protein n=1 Tax=Serratia sp. DD3 TaxID=1410619 RepID=UPI0003C4EDCE|nr:fimbrial protein [Serratia sp. DD3]KEY56959.1 S-fimbrial protein subunit SfaA [Serratia sp. DD3]
MKKLAIAVSLATVLGSVNLAQAVSTGTITFNGELTANTCDVSVNGQGANATVVLPTVGTNQLTAAGQTAGRTNFNMALTNCSGTLQTASAYFEAGSSVDLATGRLKNTTGTATLVALQLRDGSSASQAVIKVGNSSQRRDTTYLDVASGSAVLPYEVEYYANGLTTAGTVVSSVVYSIQYM